MKPLSLRLKGFIGVKKGLGLDEITLDLSGLSGLIALAGENGRSKSTILENLSPYRSLFSRAGSLNAHVFLRDSEKEFIFSYEGHTYRSLIKIDAESDRSEGFIWKDGEPQVNGKRREYDKYIVELLGSQNLFVNSVFCAQNSTRFTDLRTGELRELFAEFLRLDRLAGQEETAKGCIRAITMKAGMTDSRIEALKAFVAGKGQAATRGDEERGRIGELEGSLGAWRSSLADAREELDRAREAMAAHMASQERIRELEQALAEAEREASEVEQRGSEEIGSLLKVYGDIAAEKEGCEAVLVDRAKIEVAADKVSSLGVLIEEVAAEQAELEKEVGVLRASREAITKEIADLRQERTEAGAALKSLLMPAELLSIESSIGVAQEKARDLDLKDPACQSTTCSFIVGALKAAEELPGLEARRGQVKAEIETKEKALKEKLAGLDDQVNHSINELNRLTDVYTEMVGLVSKKTTLITGMRTEVKEAAALAALLPKIAVAESRLADLEKRLEETKLQGTETRAAWAKKIEEKKARAEEQQARLSEARSRIDIDAEAALKRWQVFIADAENEIATITKQIEEARAKLAAIEQEIAACDAHETELRELETAKALLGNETAEWTYLRNACSKTGLQALEIDGVVPHIVYDANRLLTGTFGPGYSIRIQTQDDEGKEVFRVWVIREDGDEALLENLSGGQQVWIIKALRLSMTLLSKRKSGRNFESAMADEEDGGLDVENARTFVTLYRSFMAEGGFGSFFFISHKPECLAYADHIMRFEDGGIRID